MVGRFDIENMHLNDFLQLNKIRGLILKLRQWITVLIYLGYSL